MESGRISPIPMRFEAAKKGSRHYRMAEMRSGPAASNPPLTGGGRAIADTSRKSKSP
jgi:hypothetical protein